MASMLMALTACNEFAVAHPKSPPVSSNTASEESAPVNHTIVAPEPDAAVVAPLLDAQELDMLARINQHRAQYGLRPLRIAGPLVASSLWMSQDMAARNYFDHTDSLGRSCFRRMDDFDYVGELTRGENIAAGNGASAATYLQWLYSPGHNANMLSPNFNLIGIARAYNSHSAYGWYWTTDFGRAAK